MRHSSRTCFSSLGLSRSETVLLRTPRAQALIDALKAHDFQTFGRSVVICNRFLWVNLAHLQPFEDGNKRVSRLAANIPLTLYNQAPLSFLDVDRDDYALAMMGVCEACDVSMAVDLFAWTYRRSIEKYKVVSQALGAPDPFRVKYRDALIEAVRTVVRDRCSIAEAIARLQVPNEDSANFLELVSQALDALGVFNCARYRLGMADTESWINAGRPR